MCRLWLVFMGATYTEHIMTQMLMMPWLELQDRYSRSIGIFYDSSRFPLKEKLVDVVFDLDDLGCGSHSKLNRSCRKRFNWCLHLPVNPLSSFSQNKVSQNWEQLRQKNNGQKKLRTELRAAEVLKCSVAYMCEKVILYFHCSCTINRRESSCSPEITVFKYRGARVLKGANTTHEMGGLVSV